MSMHEGTKPNCGRDVIHQNIILPWMSQRWLCSSDANNPGEILLINSENIHREHNTLITLKPTKNWTEAGVENKMQVTIIETTVTNKMETKLKGNKMRTNKRFRTN